MAHCLNKRYPGEERDRRFSNTRGISMSIFIRGKLSPSDICVAISTMRNVDIFTRVMISEISIMASSVRQYATVCFEILHRAFYVIIFMCFICMHTALAQKKLHFFNVISYFFFILYQNMQKKQVFLFTCRFLLHFTPPTVLIFKSLCYIIHVPFVFRFKREQFCAFFLSLSLFLPVRRFNNCTNHRSQIITGSISIIHRN